MVYIIPCRNLNHFISIILLNHFWHRFILVAATTAAAANIDVLGFSHSQKFFDCKRITFPLLMCCDHVLRWKFWSHVKLLHSFVCHQHRIHWMALSQCIFLHIDSIPTCTLSQSLCRCNAFLSNCQKVESLSSWLPFSLCILNLQSIFPMWSTNCTLLENNIDVDANGNSMEFTNKH